VKLEFVFWHVMLCYNVFLPPKPLDYSCKFAGGEVQHLIGYTVCIDQMLPFKKF